MKRLPHLRLGLVALALLVGLAWGLLAPPLSFGPGGPVVWAVRALSGLIVGGLVTLPLGMALRLPAAPVSIVLLAWLAGGLAGALGPAMAQARHDAQPSIAALRLEADYWRETAEEARRTHVRVAEIRATDTRGAQAALAHLASRDQARRALVRGQIYSLGAPEPERMALLDAFDLRALDAEPWRNRFFEAEGDWIVAPPNDARSREAEAVGALAALRDFAAAGPPAPGRLTAPQD